MLGVTSVAGFRSQQCDASTWNTPAARLIANGLPFYVVRTAGKAESLASRPVLFDSHAHCEKRGPEPF